VAPPARVGQHKSYRVHNNAHNCTIPGQVRDPSMAQSVWAVDAGPKLYGAATFEVRIIDCASSRRFLAELATFVAAYVHYRGERVSEEPLTPEVYEAGMVN